MVRYSLYLRIQHFYLLLLQQQSSHLRPRPLPYLVVIIVGDNREILLNRTETDEIQPCRYQDLVMAADNSLHLADLLSKEEHRFVKKEGSR